MGDDAVDDILWVPLTVLQPDRHTILDDWHTGDSNNDGEDDDDEENGEHEVLGDDNCERLKYEVDVILDERLLLRCTGTRGGGRRSEMLDRDVELGDGQIDATGDELDDESPLDELDLLLLLLLLLMLLLLMDETDAASLALSVNG